MQLAKEEIKRSEEFFYFFVEKERSQVCKVSLYKKCLKKRERPRKDSEISKTKGELKWKRERFSSFSTSKVF